MHRLWLPFLPLSWRVWLPFSPLSWTNFIAFTFMGWFLYGASASLGMTTQLHFSNYYFKKVHVFWILMLYNKCHGYNWYPCDPWGAYEITMTRWIQQLCKEFLKWTWLWYRWSLSWTLYVEANIRGCGLGVQLKGIIYYHFVEYACLSGLTWRWRIQMSTSTRIGKTHVQKGQYKQSSPSHTWKISSRTLLTW